MSRENKRMGGDHVSVSASCAALKSRPTVVVSGANFTVADGRFVLTHRLGSGAFGDIYQATDTRNNNKVAVKLEKRKGMYQQLGYESKVYCLLHYGTVDVVGIPRVYYYDSDAEYNILVMDLCGPSLEDLFNYCGRRLSIKTTCMLAQQMIDRIEFLHEKGFIHRDIKAENFVFGLGPKGHILHLIDFGLSKVYWDKRKQAHIPFCEGKSLTGTARYCSVWTHRGYEQSRRDDMEAIGFLLVYFLNGSLPWQGILAHDQQMKTTKIGEKKISMTLKDICRGLPDEILQYCTYCRQLKFTERPNYSYAREIFKGLARRLGLLTPVKSDVIIHKIPKSLLSDLSTSLTDGETPTTLVNITDIASEEEEDGYDWMFDWFLKRNKEVEEGKQRILMSPTDTATAMGNTPTGVAAESACYSTNRGACPQ